MHHRGSTIAVGVDVGAQEPTLAQKFVVEWPANGCRVCYDLCGDENCDPTANPSRGQKDAQATNESKCVLKPMGARSKLFAGGAPSPYPSTLMASQSPLST